MGGASARSEVALLAAFLSLGMLACSGNPAPSSRTGATTGTVNADTVVGVRPGDAIRLRVYRDTSLTGEFQVNENGSAVLPLLGRREVAGLTPDSLRGRLLVEYSEYLRDPAMDITVLRRISILGSVREPGLYPVDPTVSLSEALATAGGLTPDGDRDDIRLVRSGRVLQQDLNASTLLGTTPIRSGDRIFVDQKPWFERNWQWIGGTLSSALIFGLLR